MNKLPFYSIPRLAKALIYALDGLASVFKTEAAFRLEVALAAILLPVALFLDVTAAERGLLIGSISLVLVVELVNTAIETVIDRISPEIHPLSKRAKDIGSAAVLLSLLSAGAVWLAVLAG